MKWAHLPWHVRWWRNYREMREIGMRVIAAALTAFVLAST